MNFFVCKIYEIGTTQIMTRIHLMKILFSEKQDQQIYAIPFKLWLTGVRAG